MIRMRKIIALLISLMMIFCGTSSIVFAAPNTEDSFDVTEETVAAAETTEETAGEATEEESVENAAPASNANATEETAANETATEETAAADIEITTTNSPVEANQEVPAADNTMFYNVDLNTGEVTTSKHKKVKDGFKKIYGKDFSKAGIKGKAKKEKHKKIEQMTADSELYSVSTIDGNQAEICAEYSSCRLIVTGVKDVETFGAVSGVNYRGDLILKYSDEEATAKAYDSLCEKYGSEHVLQDFPVKMQEDEQEPEPWYYSMMGFSTVMEPVETYGRDITVAVIDTGINDSHIVFDGKTIIKGYDFVNEDNDPADDFGHGTAVAGIIAQSTSSNVEIMVIKSLDENGTGFVIDSLLGVDYAKEEGADIANLSLSYPALKEGPDATSAQKETANKKVKLYDEYICDFEGPIIVSAGNDRRDIETYYIWPAISEYTLCASGITQSNGEVGFAGSYSNYGDSVDFSAPGSDIKVANYKKTTEFRVGSGTSFSAPHVAAAAAMLMSNDSRVITQEQVREDLIDLSIDLGDEGFDEYFGYGCPNLANMTLNEVAQARWIKKFKCASIPVEKRIYTGSAIKPALTLTRGDKTLVEGADYTVKYSNNKNVGMAKATITGINGYFGTKEVSFRVAPKGTYIKSLARASGAITVKWNKQSAKMSTSRITGYQIQVATDSAFTKNTKKVYKTKYSSTSKKITKLKKKKKYYVRVRTYKTVSGTKYYSKWSKVKTIKTK